jgi:hypothetical protein
MKIFVGGSLKQVPQCAEICPDFVRTLGEEIVRREHTLLTGCRGSLDKAVAEAAYRALQSEGRDVLRQLISYRLKNDQPAHRFGRIQVSRREDWNLTHPELDPPEQIAEADVAIFLGGHKGTFIAANWARIADKPILGVAQFGGAGATIFERERARFANRYAGSLKIQNFDLLSQDTMDVKRLAEDVLHVAERSVTSRTIFTIMPFKEVYRPVLEAYRTVCEPQYEIERTDESDTSDRIIPRILEGIRHSAFVIADVTELTPNVVYEIGFAQGLGKRVILTARQGTALPFDLTDIPVIFWDKTQDLQEKLRRRVAGICRAAAR